jgi:hypothetical protein
MNAAHQGGLTRRWPGDLAGLLRESELRFWGAIAQRNARAAERHSAVYGAVFRALQRKQRRRACRSHQRD